MDFRNYQISSLKHLQTCKSILNAIELLKDSHSESAEVLLLSNQNAVLHNVFYLSGYTLESIVNYSIYKHFRWTKESIQEIDHNFSSKCDLAFFPNVSRRSGGTYQYWISQHDFQRNIEILRKTFRGSKLPLLDKAIAVDDAAKKLFFSWIVEVRYDLPTNTYSGIQLNYSNVKKFVELTDIIYNGLMAIVG